MVDIEFIKLRARDGWSIRETARRTGWWQVGGIVVPRLPSPLRRRGPRLLFDSPLDHRIGQRGLAAFLHGMNADDFDALIQRRVDELER